MSINGIISRAGWLMPPSAVVFAVSMVLALQGGFPAAAAQEGSFAGIWEGSVTLPTDSLLEVRVQLRRDGEVWKGTLDIPAQGAFEVPVGGIRVWGDSVTFALTSAGGEVTFLGRLEGTSIKGSVSQAGHTFPFHLVRKDAASTPHRPQTPQPPFPYLEEEVVYQNEGVTLAGTLTVPEGPGPFPAVVMITGSGAQDRDETIFGHRPFAVIADHLTRGGIAVLRVDDRGVRGSSGSLAMATLEGLAGDALAGIRTLESRPEILNRRIGLVGHSQGAKVAAIAAAQDSAVAFLVLMAGSGLPLAETAVIQARVIGEARGAEEEFLDRQEEAQRELYRLLAADADSEALRSQLKKLITVQVRAIDSSQGQDDDLIEGLVDGHLRQLTSAFSRSNSWFDPRSALREVRVPVLAITGTLDLQVPPEVHLPEIEEALREGGNRGVTIHRLPGLNHLFQRARTGRVEEYAQIEETIAPQVLNLIRDWILSLA